MTHMPGVDINFDTPSEWTKTDQVQCRKCGSKEISYRTHESSCGGWEDDEFRCGACGQSWWVDGIDS